MNTKLKVIWYCCVFVLVSGMIAYGLANGVWL